jgi:hypothetical protein
VTTIRSKRIHPASFLCISGCIAAACFLALTPVSFASPLTIPSGDVIVTVAGVDPNTLQGRSVDFKAEVNSDGSFRLSDQTSQGTEWSLTRLEVDGNVDPFTNLVFAVTNNDPVNTLLFTVSVTLPIAPQLPATLHGGSTGGTLTDANFNGSATVATSGGIPYYQGQIDGTTVLGIYPDPYSLSVAFPGQTVAVPPLNPGLPGPTLPSGPALSTIGIINRFTLTPGDTFSGNSFFVVVAVPEPSTLLLLAIACVAISGRRR